MASVPSCMLTFYLQHALPQQGSDVLVEEGGEKWRN